MRFSFSFSFFFVGGLDGPPFFSSWADEILGFGAVLPFPFSILPIFPQRQAAKAPSFCCFFFGSPVSLSFLFFSLPWPQQGALFCGAQVPFFFLAQPTFFPPPAYENPRAAPPPLPTFNPSVVSLDLQGTPSPSLPQKKPMIVFVPPSPLNNALRFSGSRYIPSYSAVFSPEMSQILFFYCGSGQGGPLLLLFPSRAPGLFLITSVPFWLARHDGRLFSRSVLASYRDIPDFFFRKNPPPLLLFFL